MTLHLLRALFVLLMSSIGYAAALVKDPGPFGAASWIALGVMDIPSPC